jgi:hypothetical protein
VAVLAEQNIKCLPFSATEIRLVTHLDFTDQMLDRAVESINKISFN